VMGEEKYVCVMLKVCSRWLSVLLGRMYWINLGVLYLFMSQIILVSNVCNGGSILVICGV
jgi:hypothetical protein